MKEKEIEKLFRSKLSNREFAFNPANWEAMETILDNAPKPAGTFYWRSVMAVLLFGVAVWSFIIFAPAVAESNVVNKTEAVSPVENIDKPQGVLSPKEEGPDKNQTEGSVAQTEAENMETERTVVSVSDEIAEQKILGNSEAEEPATVISSNEETYVGEVAVVEPSQILPLTSKGFTFNNEIPQSMVEIAPVGNFTPEAFKKFNAKSSFYLEVAPVFSGSYNANNVGVGWHAGLGWERSIGEKFQFNIGLGYTVQNGLGIENNSDSVFYNFGKEVVETQEVNRRLDYMELPISFGYKLNEKNMMELGMYAGYLVNVSRDVEKETSKFKAETAYESTKESGYQKEFKRMDYGLSLGYRYRLTPALSVGLHYNLGLVDITKNTQGDYLQRHTNQNTRVVFRYRFL